MSACIGTYGAGFAQAQYRADWAARLATSPVELPITDSAADGAACRAMQAALDATQKERREARRRPQAQRDAIEP